MRVIAWLFKFTTVINRFLFFRWMLISYTWIDAVTGKRMFGNIKLQCLFCSVPIEYVKRKVLSEGVILEAGRDIIIVNVYKYPLFHFSQ